MPVLSVIIVSWNVRDYLRACLASLFSCAEGIEYEVIVVDNCSSDCSADMVAAEFTQVTLVRSAENVGFARATNLGYEKARGEYILLLNPDTVVKPGAIAAVLEFMQKEPSAGVAGCRIVGADGHVQKSVFPFPTVGRNLAQTFFLDRLLFPDRKPRFYYGHEPKRVDCVGGAFMMVRRAALKSGPLLNPDYFMYAEEKDLCLRLKRAGWSTWFVPKGEIVHYGGKSTDSIVYLMNKSLQRSQAIYYKTFYPLAYALLLCISWWIVLVGGAIASISGIFTEKGRQRLAWFVYGVVVFPVIALRVIVKKS